MLTFKRALAVYTFPSTYVRTRTTQNSQPQRPSYSKTPRVGAAAITTTNNTYQRESGDFSIPCIKTFLMLIF